MSVQDFIVYIIIFAAIVYTAYNIYDMLRKKKQNACGCSSSSCNVHDLKSTIIKHKKVL